MKNHINVFIILIIFMISGCKRNKTDNQFDNVEEDITKIESVSDIKSESFYTDTDEVFFFDWDRELYGIYSTMGMTKVRLDLLFDLPIQNKDNLKTVDYDDDGITDYYYENGQMVGYYDKELFHGKGGLGRFSFDNYGRMIQHYAVYDYDSDHYYNDYRYEYKIDTKTNELVRFLINNGKAVEEYREQRNENIIELSVLKRRSEYRNDIREIKDEFKVLSLKGTVHINDDGKIDDICVIYIDSNTKDEDSIKHTTIKYNSDGSVEEKVFFKDGPGKDFYLKEYKKIKLSPKVFFLFETYDKDDSGKEILKYTGNIEYLDKDRFNNYTKLKTNSTNSDWEYVQTLRYTYGE